MARSELTASACTLALAAPPLAVTACIAILLVAAAAGVHPFWRETPVTLLDAVLAGDHARVLQMIRQGHDPNRGAAAGTLLDHAVRRDDARLVRLLLTHGVVLDEAARREVACTALRRGAEDIYTLVREGRAWTCDEVR